MVLSGSTISPQAVLSRKKKKNQVILHQKPHDKREKKRSF